MFQIPNLFTLANLFCGCTALLMLIRSDSEAAGLFLGLCLLFDLLDGLAARLLGQQSALGKELDSLADMVSFGLLPGFIYYFLLAEAFHPDPELGEQLFFEALPAFLLTLFSALRLGKFNLDDRQTDHFLGLPTPACTIFVVGLLLAKHYDSPIAGPLAHSAPFLYLCIGGSCLLLISEIPMLSLKARNLSWRENQARFLLLAASLLLLLFLGLGSLPFVIIFYLLLSLTSEFHKDNDQR